MPLSIYSNLSSHEAQLRLGRSQEQVTRVMAQLSSGLRIADVADDPEGLGVSQGFEAQVRGYHMAERNTQDGISMLQTVDGALSHVETALQRMRELSVQAATGTLTSVDRANIQSEFAQLQTEISRIAGSTRFGSLALLAADSTVTLQVGPNNQTADTIAVAVTARDATVLKVDTIKVDTQTGATASMSTIDTAINALSADRARYGAVQNRLRVALDNDRVWGQNLSAAVGRIRDVDVAEASARLARLQVLTQAGVAVLAQANQVPQMALSLLRG
jgi:flagellin